MIHMICCMTSVISFPIQALSGIFPLRAPLTSTPHILVIFDNISAIPLTPFFKELLKNTNTHVIITFNPTRTPKDLIKMIDRELIRGTNTIDLKPLSSLLTTQRLVHSIMKGCDTDDFVPYNEEQKMISLITEQTGGSPDIIDITSTVLTERLAKGDIEERRGILQEFCEENVVTDNGESSRKEGAPKIPSVEDRIASDSVSATVVSTESVARNRQPEEEKEALNQTTVVRFMTNLLQNLHLPQSDYFLLKALHWFGTAPIPRQLIEILQSIIVSASKHQRPAKTPMVNLLSHKLLRVYPSTVIVKPANSQLPYSTHAAASSSTDSTATSFIADSDFYYVPQLAIDSVQGQLQPMDRDFSLTAAFKALSHYCKESDCDLTHAAGLANVLYNKIDEQNVCFQVVYRLYLSLATRTGN